MTIGCLIGTLHKPTVAGVLLNGLFSLPVVPKTGSWTLSATPLGWTSTGTVSMAVNHNYGTFYPRWGGAVADVSQCVRLFTGSSLSTTINGLTVGRVYSIYYWRRTEVTYSDLTLVCSVNATTIASEAVGGGSNLGLSKTATWTANATSAVFTLTCNQISTPSVCIVGEAFFGGNNRLTGSPTFTDTGGIFSNPTTTPSSAASTNYTMVGGTAETIKPDGTTTYWFGNIRWREQLLNGTQCVWYGADGGTVTLRVTASTGPWVLNYPYILTYHAASRADMANNCKLVVKINGTVIRDHGELPRSNYLTWYTVTWYCNSISASPVVEFIASQATTGGRLVLASVQFRG